MLHRLRFVLVFLSISTFLAPALSVGDTHVHRSTKDPQHVTKLGSSVSVTLSLPLTTVQEYRVEAGDTLISIANKLHIPSSNLLICNDVTNPNFLQVGERVYYTSIPPENATVHRSGDTASKGKGKGEESTRNLGALSLPWSQDTITNSTLVYCTLTAYTAGFESTHKRPGDRLYGITSTGRRVKQGVTVAVDPTVIPYGTKMFIPGIGYRIAEDTGGDIIGNHIDIYYNDVSVARHFGVKHKFPVYILPMSFPLPGL